jgi:hypothetical protein
MSDTEDPIEEADAPRLAPLPMRVVQVFVSPVRLFQALRERPVAWGAILLGAVLAAASNLVIPAELFEDMMRNQIAQAGGEAPADLGMMVTIGRIGGTVGALIFFPITIALTAGLFSLLFLFGFGFEGRFKQYFAVAAHASLILSVAGALLTPLRILSGDIQFNLTLGGLFPFLGDGLAGRFLGLLDLFALWAIALVGVGAAVIDGNKGAGAAAAMSVGTLLLILLVVASFGFGGGPG